MATEKELQSLVINKVESTDVYNYMKQHSLLNEDELYLVLGNEEEKVGKNVVGATNATENTSTALTNGNVYLNSVENGNVTSSHKISGSGATTVTTDTSGNIIISSTDNDTVYTHPSYTARTGVPTENLTPAFGGTFSVSQPVSDKTGHITAINSRTITIPSTTATTSENGLMSSSDKTKLNGISTSAKNIIVSSTQPTNQSAGDFWYKVV